MGKTIYLIMVLALVLLVSCTTEKNCPPCTQEDCPECPDCMLDCTTCPPKIEYRDVIEYKYVCPNGATVSEKSACSEPVEYDLKEASTTGQQFYLTTFEIEPACIYGENGGEIEFETSTSPQKVVFQVKETTEDEFENVLEVTGLYKARKTFDFQEKFSKGDFNLEKGKLYVFRLMLDFNSGANPLGIEYSREVFIDGREGSSFFAKIC